MHLKYSISLGFQRRLTLHFGVSQQIVAAIFAIAGIVMMTYADGFHSHSVIGIALVVGSASTSALYKVMILMPPQARETKLTLRFDVIVPPRIL